MFIKSGTRIVDNRAIICRCRNTIRDKIFRYIQSCGDEIVSIFSANKKNIFRDLSEAE